MSATTSVAARPAAGLALVAALLLGACRHAPTTDPHSQFYVVPEGSWFTLHQEVTIPVRGAQIYIQNSRVTPSLTFTCPTASWGSGTSVITRGPSSPIDS